MKHRFGSEKHNRLKPLRQDDPKQRKSDITKKILIGKRKGPL